MQAIILHARMQANSACSDLSRLVRQVVNAALSLSHSVFGRSVSSQSLLRCARGTRGLSKAEEICEKR